MDNIPVSVFLDSGAFSLRKKRLDDYAPYLDEYAKFIIKWQKAIDLYANVDVIPNPELTWRNQQYLETKWGLRPVPVVHYGEEMKWVDRYLESVKYPLIGCGGLVGKFDRWKNQRVAVGKWIDSCFKRVGIGGIHGFGITPGVSNFSVVDFPWASIDHTTWFREPAMGGVLVPTWMRGKVCFDRRPVILKATRRRLDPRAGHTHIYSLSNEEKKKIEEWFGSIGISIEKCIDEESARRLACVAFFERVSAAKKLVTYYSGCSDKNYPPPPATRIMVSFANKRGAERLLNEVLQFRKGDSERK